MDKISNRPYTIGWFSEKYMVNLCLELLIEIHPATRHGWHTNIEDFWTLSKVDKDYLFDVLRKWLFTGINRQAVEDGNEIITKCNFINIGIKTLNIRAKRI